MKISIITATLNNKAGLIRAIESVRRQTYKNVEHIIVDGLSNDGTAEAIYNLQLTINNDMSSRANARDLKISLPIDRDRNDKDKHDRPFDSPLQAGTPDPSSLDFARDDTELRVPSGQVAQHFGKQGDIPFDSAQGDKSLLTTHYSLLTIREADTGIYDAINKGIKLATGDVIGLLHSDDFYHDEFVLEKYAEAFAQSAERKAHSEVEAVYGDLVYVRNKTRDEKRKKNNSESIDHSALKMEHSVIRTWKTHSSHFDPPRRAGFAQCDIHRMTKLILNGWMPPHPTLFIKKEIFDKYGLYRTDMKIAADYEMILRLFYKHKITTSYLPQTTYCMSIGGASNKSLKNIFIKSSEDYKAMKMHGIPFPLYTLLYKNLSKLPQFFG